MNLSDEVIIPVPRQKVWEGLNDPEVLKQFYEYKWYVAVHENLADVEAQLMEVDKHNVAFLNRVIMRLGSNLAVND